jgi:hypothetical protein
MTSATPAPLAAGATKTTSAEAAVASASAVDDETAAKARSGGSARLPAEESNAAAAAARRARVRTVTACSTKKARTPTTRPTARVMTHFETRVVWRPVRRKLR